MVLDYSSFTCVGLCRDVVCIVFGNQTEQSGVGAGRRKREKNVGMNMKMSMRRKSARSSKREREAQAYAKDQRPKRKKRRWKIILEDIDSWEKYSFTFCDSVGIGRGKDGSMYERYLPLTSDGRISKLHCVIIHKNDKLYVKDEDSRNGTYLNGVRIDRPMEIQRDDIIGVGETRLEVQRILRESD